MERTSGGSTCRFSEKLRNGQSEKAVVYEFHHLLTATPERLLCGLASGFERLDLGVEAVDSRLSVRERSEPDLPPSQPRIVTFGLDRNYGGRSVRDGGRDEKFAVLERSGILGKVVSADAARTAHDRAGDYQAKENLAGGTHETPPDPEVRARPASKRASLRAAAIQQKAEPVVGRFAFW
jgi:hypothetical protein